MNLSLVIPIYNEEENLPLLFDALYNTMNALGQSWEVILVDDGSQDNSLAVLKSMRKKTTNMFVSFLSAEILDKLLPLLPV